MTRQADRITDKRPYRGIWRGVSREDQRRCAFMRARPGFYGYFQWREVVDAKMKDAGFSPTARLSRRKRSRR